MNMLPIECIVRGYFYGSMVSRWKNNEIFHINAPTVGEINSIFIAKKSD